MVLPLEPSPEPSVDRIFCPAHCPQDGRTEPSATGGRMFLPMSRCETYPLTALARDLQEDISLDMAAGHEARGGVVGLICALQEPLRCLCLSGTEGRNEIAMHAPVAFLGCGCGPERCWTKGKLTLLTILVMPAPVKEQKARKIWGRSLCAGCAG